MLVQCPKCKTTYKVADDIIAKGATPSFRCSRCKHTFELAAEAELSPTAPDSVPESARASSELAFTFESAERADAPPTGSDSQPAVHKSQDLAAPGDVGGGPESNDPSSQSDERTLSSTPAAPAPLQDSISATPRSEKEELDPASSPREPIDSVVVVDIERNQAASVKPFLTLFVLLVLTFAFIAAYQRIHPAATVEWMRGLPLLGRLVAHNDHVRSGVLLKSVETNYQSLQGSREVVVLTGVAVNQNPVMIRNVQLAGRLFDKEGKEIERQTMWIGNAISPQIIRGMTAQDVSDLQRLKPLKTFEIPSGDSVPFAIVFLRAGKPVQDARCEVLSAEADA